MTNAPHDLGGRLGYGPVQIDALPRGFAERWHAAVFTMVNVTFASGAARNTDYFRHAVERVAPDRYLADGYYGRWLGGVETMLIEAGQLAAGAIDERLGEQAAPSAARPGGAAMRSDWRVETHASAQRSPRDTARFAVGDRIRTRELSGHGHCRLPGYARGRFGEVTAVHGHWVFPDASAHGEGEQPQVLYTVAFAGRELWGADAESGLSVRLDLFEPYLEAV